jgi:hypothetical protein
MLPGLLYRCLQTEQKFDPGKTLPTTSAASVMFAA